MDWMDRFLNWVAEGFMEGPIQKPDEVMGHDRTSGVSGLINSSDNYVLRMNRIYQMYASSISGAYGVPYAAPKRHFKASSASQCCEGVDSNDASEIGCEE